MVKGCEHSWVPKGWTAEPHQDQEGRPATPPLQDAQSHAGSSPALTPPEPEPRWEGENGEEGVQALRWGGGAPACSCSPWAQVLAQVSSTDLLLCAVPLCCFSSSSSSSPWKDFCPYLEWDGEKEEKKPVRAPASTSPRPLVAPRGGRGQRLLPAPDRRGGLALGRLPAPRPGSAPLTVPAALLGGRVGQAQPKEVRVVGGLERGRHRPGQLGGPGGGVVVGDVREVLPHGERALGRERGGGREGQAQAKGGGAGPGVGRHAPPSSAGCPTPRSQSPGRP